LEPALLAEADGQPAGLAWGRIEEDDPDIAFLYQMWVAPDHRGSSVGKMLLERMISWAEEMNSRILHLGVTDRDSPAMRLYQRAGFEPVGEPRPLRAGSEIMGQPMRLTLSKES
jgi:GNAT superfamily N-acetyltransferase